MILSRLFVTTLQGQGRVLIPRSCLSKLLVWVLYIVNLTWNLNLMWGGNFSKAQYLAGFKKESTLFLSALLNSTHKTRACYLHPYPGLLPTKKQT